MKRLTVLIPAYNEADSIEAVISSLPRKIGKARVQVVVVDDGSTDTTAAVAEEAGAVVVIHPQNRGVGKAFHTGLEQALEMGSDLMVNIDADGQFAAADIPRLIEQIVEDRADFVCGDRFTHGGDKTQRPLDMPKEKFWGNLLMNRFIGFLAQQQFTDVSCGFRAYSKKAMLMLNLTGKFTYTQESFIDLAFKGLRIAQVPVAVRYDPARKSKVAASLWRYAYKTLKIIIRAFRDYRPLLFFIYLSIAPFILGLITGGFLLGHYVIANRFTPYKFLGFASIYLVSLSIFLWIMGFIADMFVRIRMNQEKLLYFEKLKRYD